MIVGRHVYNLSIPGSRTCNGDMMCFNRTKSRICLFIIVTLLSACTPKTGVETKSPTPQTAAPLTDGLQEVQGTVLGGGDTSPPGLMDAPRTFVYQVKLESGEEIQVQYTAYPPSPAADALPKVQIDLYAGEIRVGDYLTARGMYDSATRTLLVAADGDSIQTYEKKP